MKAKKPRKSDLFKGKKKVIPIRLPDNEMPFEEKVQKFGQYVQDPEQYGKIFSELGFTYVDDGCDGECESCEQQSGCSVYPSIKECETSEKKKQQLRKVVPFKKKPSEE